MNRLTVILLLIMTLLTGCTTPQSLRLYNASHENPLEPNLIDLDEMEPATYYSFKNGNDIRNIVFFFSGSGCSSHKNYIKPYLENLQNSNIFALQKVGIKNNDLGFLCSNEFQRNDNLETALQRQKKFISEILKTYGNKAVNIILFGVSEGTIIAGSLINNDERFTHLVLIAPVGKKLLDSVLEIGPKFGISKNEIEIKITQIKNNPESNSEYFAGKTFRYWSTYSKYEPQDVLGNIKKPTIIGMGELDINTPLAPIKLIFDKKVLSGDTNLNLITYSNSNHTLVNDKGNSNREQFLEEVNNFLTKTSNN